MIDYDFYVNSYLGTAIPEKAFSGVVARAENALAAIKRRYQVLPADGVSEKMAVCAMAEVLHTGSRPGVTAATVGSVSVRYGSSSQQRQLLEKARIYLDIYRGAKPWDAP